MPMMIVFLRGKMVVIVFLRCVVVRPVGLFVGQGMRGGGGVVHGVQVS